MSDPVVMGRITQLESKTNQTFQQVDRARVGGGLGIAINVGALTFNPTDGQTVYFGNVMRAPTTIRRTSKIFVHRNCMITRVDVYCTSVATASADPWNLYIRVNDERDYLIASVGIIGADRRWFNDGMGVALKMHDYFEMKLVNPSWATNPTGALFGGYVVLE